MTLIANTFPKLRTRKDAVKYDKGAAVMIWKVFEHVYHVACRRVLWNGTFRYLYNLVFAGRNFGNTWDFDMQNVKTVC